MLENGGIMITITVVQSTTRTPAEVEKDQKDFPQSYARLYRAKTLYKQTRENDGFDLQKVIRSFNAELGDE